MKNACDFHAKVMLLVAQRPQSFSSHCLWLTAFTSILTYKSVNASFNINNSNTTQTQVNTSYMHTVMHTAQRDWKHQAEWQTYQNSKIYRQQTSLTVPLISNPFPHDSVAPVIPCWTESGTRVHGCHWCVFHLQKRKILIAWHKMWKLRCICMVQVQKLAWK